MSVTIDSYDHVRRQRILDGPYFRNGVTTHDVAEYDKPATVLGIKVEALKDGSLVFFYFWRF